MSQSGDGRWSKSIYAHEPLVTSEVRIWRGVLEQAYVDAESSPGGEAEDEDVRFIEQIRARRFLRGDTPGEKEELRLVCDYAEIPFDRVVMWARRHYAPSAQQDLEKVEARDAKEVEEIVKAAKDRETIRHGGKFAIFLHARRTGRSACATYLLYSRLLAAWTQPNNLTPKGVSYGVSLATSVRAPFLI